MKSIKLRKPKQKKNIKLFNNKRNLKFIKTFVSSVFRKGTRLFFRNKSQQFLDTSLFKPLTHIPRSLPRYRYHLNSCATYEPKTYKKEIFSKDKRFRVKNIRRRVFSFLNTIHIKKKSKFFLKFWQKYKGISVQKDYFRMKALAADFVYFDKWRDIVAEEKLVPPINPDYSFNFFMPWYAKSKVFSLWKGHYKRDLWFSPLYSNRKLYRLTRTRDRFRKKRHKFQRRLYYYNLFFNLNYPRSKITRGKHLFRIHQLLRKYIMLPYFWNFTSKQFKNLARKMRQARHVLSYKNSNAKYENRLDVIAYNLNLAPTIYWSRMFIHFGWIWIGHNSCSLKNCKNTFYLNSIQNNNCVKFIKNTSFNKIKVLTSIKNKWYEKTQNFKNLQSLKIKELVDQKPEFYPTYIVKTGDIIQWSPYLKKILSLFFMNRLRKKRIPFYIRLNSEKTAALFTEHYYTGSVLNKGRLSYKYLRPVLLQRTR